MKQFEIRSRTYFISSDGKVFDVDGIEQSLRIHRGYVYFKRKTIHRLVAKLFISNFWNGCEIHHIDFDKNNNTVTNLQCLTRKEHVEIHKNRSII